MWTFTYFQGGSITHQIWWSAGHILARSWSQLIGCWRMHHDHHCEHQLSLEGYFNRPGKQSFLLIHWGPDIRAMCFRAVRRFWQNSSISDAFERPCGYSSHEKYMKAQGSWKLRNDPIMTPDPWKYMIYPLKSMKHGHVPWPTVRFFEQPPVPGVPASCSRFFRLCQPQEVLKCMETWGAPSQFRNPLEAPHMEVFHSHGVSPIAGWFTEGKIPI